MDRETKAIEKVGLIIILASFFIIQQIEIIKSDLSTAAYWVVGIFCILFFFGGFFAYIVPERISGKES
tara:strand:+ start:495 stop:698 length:204 start_codon:yes stop_codon:yes gene_type:complete